MFEQHSYAILQPRVRLQQCFLGRMMDIKTEYGVLP